MHAAWLHAVDKGARGDRGAQLARRQPQALQADKSTTDTLVSQYRRQIAPRKVRLPQITHCLNGLDK